LKFWQKRGGLLFLAHGVYCPVVVVVVVVVVIVIIIVVITSDAQKSFS